MEPSLGAAPVVDRALPGAACWLTRLPARGQGDGIRVEPGALQIVFGDRGIYRDPGQGLLTSYVRVMDKTVLEYEAARHSLTEWVTTPKNVMSPLFRTIDHLETCVDSLHRASQFAERLRRLQSAPQIHMLKLPRDKERGGIRKARDAIQHADADIRSGGSGEPTGHSVALFPTEDRFEAGGHEVAYRDLARWIEKYHALVSELIRYEVG
jgi:hypothetical protein